MARTKETVTKSTGGRAPRKKLAMKAARLTEEKDGKTFTCVLPDGQKRRTLDHNATPAQGDEIDVSCVSKAVLKNVWLKFGKDNVKWVWLDRAIPGYKKYRVPFYEEKEKDRYTAEEFCLLFGDQVKAFVDDVSCLCMTQERAPRIALTNSVNDNVVYDDVCVSGTERGHLRLL